MNFRFRAAAGLLAVSLVASSAFASDATPPAKKHATRKARAAAAPKVEDQIQQLKQELEGQIQGLRDQLSAKDAQLQQAQQAAADAQAAAARAQAAATAQMQAVNENAAAVSTLQGTVSDLKSNEASLAATVSDENTKIKKEIESPDVLHFKGIALTPGGFAAGETVWRQRATGGDIPTAFSALPYEQADAYTLSEFYGSARQSRISLLAEGKVNWGTIRGYYEADWLGTGTSSNANQSNSYVLRQRVIYAEAETNSHFKVAAGQMWSLATETKKGISESPSDVLTPPTIDPNYVTGFVWTRQYGARFVKSFDHVAIGASFENPQVIYSASLAGNTPFAVLGSAGNNGGAYNATISTCSPSTSIVNYSNQVETTSGGDTVDISVPVYKTVNACTNVTNISFNVAPDVLAKVAIDPGFGHYEIFGIGRFAHETVYPGETTNGYLYGGLKDIVSGNVVTPALTTAGAYTNSVPLGGLGASFRVPVTTMASFGIKGLAGRGVGRYGDTTLSDVTSDNHGELAPLGNISGLGTLEITPNPRTVIYFNYGGDYVNRRSFEGTTLGAPSAAQNASGVWGGHWKSPSPAAVGYGSYILNNSSCLTVTAPADSGSGYLPGGSCGANTRDVQEGTAGYWYYFYKGEHGAFRQGFQYAYTLRTAWTGAAPSGSPAGTPGIGAKGVDNMFWTSLRYYFP